MKYILLLLAIISCQNKEANNCTNSKIVNGKNTCVVGVIIWNEMETPKFMRDIQESRKNPRMYR